MEYQIGDFSIISRLSIKTLRYYHECGILSPTRIDNFTGYRYYDDKTLDKVGIITTLKDFDFSLKEIKEILDNYNEDSQIIEYIIKKQKEIKEKINNYKDIEKRLTQFIKNEEEIKMTNYSNDIIIKDLSDILIAGIRFKGKYNEVGKYIGKIIKQCSRNLTGSNFSLYFEGEYKEEDADIESCFEVKNEVNVEDITSRSLKGGKAITIIHKGPYEEIGKSYKKIIDFINSNKIQTELPIREKHLKGPGMIFRGNPKNYLTEIQIMMKK